MAFAVILNAPFAMAETVDPEKFRCEIPSGMEEASFNIDKETLYHQPNYLNETKSEYEEKLAAEVESKKGNKCGKVNDFTKYIEKADCTSSGQSIVEITESFASKAAYGNTNEVHDVYRGLCCLFVDPDTLECKDTRTVYYDDLSKCIEGADYCQRRQWLVSTSGAGLMKLYIRQIYAWGAGTAGFIAVVVIIVSGIQIQVSGVSGDISSAKQRITQSLAGLALIFLSGVLLLAINPDFFGS